MFVRLQRQLTRIIEWKARNALSLLRVSLGVVFFWFGFLKFFPGVSTAEAIASKTISWLTVGQLPPSASMPLLGTWECIIGIGLLMNRHMVLILLLLYCQMIGTLLPLAVFRQETWTNTWFVPTLLGQYIIKNAVLISSAIVLGATVQGGGLSAHPFVRRLIRRKAA